MEILLHKVCGRPASRTMTLRAAGPEDAAAFYALQNEVRAAMPHPEQFVPDTLENIARYLKEDLCIGGKSVGAKIAAHLGSAPEQQQDKGSCIVVMATDLPLCARQLERVVKRASVGLARLGSYIGHGSGEAVFAKVENLLKV